MILDIRNKPFRKTIYGIRTKLMIKYNRIRTKTESTRCEVAPHYSKKNDLRRQVTS
jgi:hypothetical protein